MADNTIGTVYVQVSPSVEGITGKITGAMSDEGGSGGSAFGSAFIKGAGATIAAGMAGVSAITKSAVDSYANYEQLVGGVDTLFKSASKTVQENAARAFETAGLSANEYMESVTSFSASLLQSVGGDTAKAAEIADRALIDMSDNANKMGSDMSSIQNAYQGFAKQNYTMLDNLKLGYGGTKSEMERLLKDAEKLTGVKYNIENLADVYDAIHAIQTNLDITGTTAKEASTTISGSLGMVKAAWQNVLTGIADENADFGKQLGSLVTSVSTFMNNIKPRIATALAGVGEMIKTLGPVIASALPELVSSVLPVLLDAAVTMVNSLCDILPGLVSTLIAAISANLPAIITALVQVTMTIVQAIIENLPMLILLITDAIVECLPQLVDGLVELVDMIVDHLPEIIDALIIAVPKIVKALVDAFIKLAPKFLEVGKKLINVLWDGAVKIFDEIKKSKVGQKVQEMINSIVAFKDKLKDAGKNLIDGLWNGIKDNWDTMVSNVTGLATGMIDKVKGVFGIHSPSKIFEEIGGYITEGFNIGLDDFSDVNLAGVNAEVQNTIAAANSFDRSVPVTNNDSAVYDLLAQYLPLLGRDNNVNVELHGDAAGMFRMMRKENASFKKMTGSSAFT